MRNHQEQVEASYPREILLAEAAALEAAVKNIDHNFGMAIDCLLNIQGRIVVTGIGKSGYIGRKVAATLASTGSSAFFLHPAEANHGDLGMLTIQDAILAFSNSGNTDELQAIIQHAIANNIPLIAVTKNINSKLAKHATYVLLQPDVPEADAYNCVPTTSTAAQMGIGDAIALTLMKKRSFTADDFHKFHPGGFLGQKLLKVEEIMHTGANMPLADYKSAVNEVLLVMTGSYFGVAGIIKDNELVGIITDGDLRRHIRPDLLELTAADIMNPEPITVEKGMLASKSLHLMKEKRITCLFVVEKRIPIGFFNMHDLLRFNIK